MNKRDVNGLRQGDWEYYTSDGKLISKGFMLNNRNHGIWWTFNEKYTRKFLFHSDKVKYSISYEKNKTMYIKGRYQVVHVDEVI